MPDRKLFDDCNLNVKVDKSFTMAFGIRSSTATHFAFAAASIPYAHVLTPLRLKMGGITYLCFADFARDGAQAKPTCRPETLHATEGIVGR